jgi:hypothetical protein
MAGGLGSGCSSGLGLRGRGLVFVVSWRRLELIRASTNRMGSLRLLSGIVSGLRLLVVVVVHGVLALAHLLQRA